MATIALLTVSIAAIGSKGGGATATESTRFARPRWVHSRICDALHARVEAKAAVDGITGSMSLAEVAHLTDRELRAAHRSDAVTGGGTIGLSTATLAKIRTRLVEQWRTVGGPGLQRRADRDESTIATEIYSAVVATGGGATQARASARLILQCVPVTGPPSRLPPHDPDLRILALRGTTSLSVFDLGGHIVERFTSPAPIEARMVLSPDGHTLAVSDPSAKAITRIDLAGGAVSHHPGQSFVWDSDGSDVWAHVSLAPDDESAIAKIRPDGTAVQRTATFPTYGIVSAITAGGDFLYSSGRGIRRFDPNTGRTRSVVRQPSCSLAGTDLNPAGTEIAYDVLCADPALDGIWTARVDGTHRRQVYAGEVAPVTWSPDGRWIAFGQDHRPSTAPSDESLDEAESRKAIFVMRADGSDIGRVTAPGYRAVQWLPTSSPLLRQGAGSGSSSVPASTPVQSLG
jgi:hypothetical protein